MEARYIYNGNAISNNYKYDSAAWLWYTTYGWQSGPIIPDWCNIGEKFIGVRLCYTTDTLYGWIRVEAISQGTSSFQIKIKDFACNKNLYIGINEFKNQFDFEVFSNPTSNKVNLILKK